ncbi:hypothetical protein L873DRAFT_1822003, partial [Choiromyces venosus 120613-1]
MCPLNRSIQGSVPEFEGCQVLLGRRGVPFFRRTCCISITPLFLSFFFIYFASRADII